MGENMIWKIKLSFILGILIFYSSIWAQGEFLIDLNYLVPAELQSPFEVSLEELSKQNRAMENRIQDAMSDIIREETRLFENKKHVESQGYNAEEFMAEFLRRSELLPIGEQAMLNRGTSIPPGKLLGRSNEFKSLLNLVNVGVQMAGDFIAQFEKYDRDSQDLEIAVGLKLLRLEIEYLRQSPVGGPGLEILKNSYQEIIKYKDDYLANKFQYGQAKDIHRVTPFNKFIGKVRSTIGQIHRFDSLGKDKKPNPFVTAMKDKLRVFGTAAMPAAARIASSTLLKLQPNRWNVPVTTAINYGARIFGVFKGEKVVVIGRENLPTGDDSETVNLILPNHGNAEIDINGIAHLGLNKSVMFVAAGNFVPENVAPDLIKALNENHGVVVVGTRNNPNPVDPVEKMRDIDDFTSVRSYVLFPQGMRPAKDNAASPVRDGPFRDNGPIRMLERNGKKVNLVLVTMDYFAPYGLNGGNDDPTIVVRVHPTIPDLVRRRFMAVGGVKALPILLQYGLLGNLRSNKLPNGEIDPDGDIFWGKVRASKLDSILSNYLKSRAGLDTGFMCRRYYSFNF